MRKVSDSVGSTVVHRNSCPLGVILKLLDIERMKDGNPSAYKVLEILKIRIIFGKDVRFLWTTRLLFR